MDSPIVIEEELRQMLDIPKEQQLVMVIPLGIPTQEPQPPDRMPVSKVVTYV
jgi:nitroreductase